MIKSTAAGIVKSPPAFDANARDYERVARAIDYLRRHATAQPELAAIARHIHLSEHHFQRLFTRWVGVSPKRFLQYLTVEHAKARLARTTNILDLTADVGLSSPGRLHDLFVTLEAASPGEIRSGGAGLQIRFGIHDSPFGACLIATTARGVCAVRFVDRVRGGDAASLLRDEWPQASLVSDTQGTADVARRICEPLAQRCTEPLALLVKGTNFQLQVWRALLEVPFGHLISYREVAAQIGHPAAARAVGNAIGANPIACLIPCHRVIRESGTFGRYRWGETRKAAILGWEAAQSEG
jgi:AraC family transcriptional regulator of adaptative response/methylated-DNA-[protein]-cysteine methyltransferase